MEVIYAVNCGGDQFTDSNGIFYTKDIQTEGVSFTWFKINVASRPPINFGGVSGNDNTIYNIARTTIKKSGYELPVAGNGLYGLLLQFSEDSFDDRRNFNVLLNGKHTLLSNYGIFKKCGLYNICNEIFYFAICNGVLWFANQTSIIRGPTILLSLKEVKLNTAISGIVLFKGNVGESMEMNSINTTIIFEKKYENQCNLSKKNLDPLQPCVTNVPATSLCNNVTIINNYITINGVSKSKQGETSQLSVDEL
jgi:hypothetical protein